MPVVKMTEMETGTVNLKPTIWAAALGLILRLLKAILAVFYYPTANREQLIKSGEGSSAKSRSFGSAERYAYVVY